MWDWASRQAGDRGLGIVQIPPQPPRIGMTDRSTGTQYWLGYDGAHITLSTTAPSAPTRVYASFDGPFLAAFGLKLAISSGRLLFETVRTDAAAPPYAFQDYKNTAQLTAQTLGRDPSTFDHLGFIAQSTQPANPTQPVTPFPPYIP